MENPPLSLSFQEAISICSLNPFTNIPQAHWQVDAGKRQPPKMSMDRCADECATCSVSVSEFVEQEQGQLKKKKIGNFLGTLFDGESHWRQLPELGWMYLLCIHLLGHCRWLS